MIATLKEHSDAVYAVAFLPGGTQLRLGGRRPDAEDLGRATGKRLFTITDSLDAVYTVAVHPSGRWFAAAGADRMIRTWAWNGDAASARRKCRARCRPRRSRTASPFSGSPIPPTARPGLGAAPTA